MPHRSEIKVRFYELDPYNHANHTSYLAYFETARIEYLADMGFGMDVLASRGWQLVVIEMKARFRAAARLHDLLAIETRVGEIGRVRSTWLQEMSRDGEAVASLEVSAAFTGMDGRPVRVPTDFAAAVSAGPV